MLVLAVARPSGPSASAAKERRTVGSPRNFLPFTIQITRTTTTSVVIPLPANQTAGQAAAQSAADIELPDVPTSKLFDPLAPRSVYAEITLGGPQPEALKVAVAVEGQSKTAEGTAVFQPKVLT